MIYMEKLALLLNKDDAFVLIFRGSKEQTMRTVPPGTRYAFTNSANQNLSEGVVGTVAGCGVSTFTDTDSKKLIVDTLDCDEDTIVVLYVIVTAKTIVEEAQRGNVLFTPERLF